MAKTASNVLVLADVRPNESTAPTLTPANNTIRVNTPQPGFNPEQVTIEEATGALDASSDVFAGGFQQPALNCYLRGSGVAGTAPDFAPLLKGCAMSETALGAAVTGTASAGAAGTLTLDDATGVEKGMVIELTGGTGYNASTPDDMWRVITAVSGNQVSVFPDFTVTPDNTTTYSVPVLHRYAPISNNIPFVDIKTYFNDDAGGNSVLFETQKSRGTFTISVSPRQAAALNFSYRGDLVSPVDVANPGSATKQTSRPPIWMAAKAVQIGGQQVSIPTFSFDYGAEVTQLDDALADFGYSEASISRRRASGSMNPPMANIATRNVFSDMQAGTAQNFWTFWGSVAGNRISLWCPTVTFTSVSFEDINGRIHEALQFSVPGDDSSIFMSFC